MSNSLGLSWFSFLLQLGGWYGPLAILGGGSYPPGRETRSSGMISGQKGTNNNKLS